MPSITPLHLEHARGLFFAGRSRREAIRGSLSTPVAAISFAVFALSTLSTSVEPDRWRQLSTLLIMLFGGSAAAALFASAYQVIMSEWLFVYHEPPRLADLLEDEPARTAEEDEEWVRGVLAASYAVAYEQYLSGNAMSAQRRTWALRLILLSLVLQAAAFVILPIHRAA